MPTKEARQRTAARKAGNHVTGPREGWHANKDAVDCLLVAFSYPTTAPLIDTAFVTKLKKEKE